MTNSDEAWYDEDAGPLVLRVLVRGKLHVRLQLARLSGQHAERLREQLAAMGGTPTGAPSPRPVSAH